MSSQKEAQKAEEYILELGKRHKQWNNAPEGEASAQQPLPFIIPVPVSYFYCLQFQAYNLRFVGWK